MAQTPNKSVREVTHPQFFNHNTNTKFYTRYISKLSQEQLEVINSIGFGFLFHIQITRLCHKLIYWMAMSIDESEMVLTFKDGTKYPIQMGDIAEILRLIITSKPIMLNDV